VASASVPAAGTFEGDAGDGGGEGVAPTKDDALERAILPVRSKLVDCYKSGIARAPQLAGKVTFGITLRDDGGPQSIVAESNDGISAAVVACVVARLKETRFTESNGARVTLPLHFWSDNGYDGPRVGVRFDPGY
jgi:hypothetical protein